MKNKINVYSEIEPLESVLIHRPGKEIENLTPDLLERLLFDDIPFLKVAQKEHDKFAEVLKNNKVQVFYIEKLVQEALDQNPDLKEKFVNQFIDEAKIEKEWRTRYKEFLLSMSNLDMVNEMIGGTKKIDLDSKDRSDYPFISDPLPNLLFQRDPFASVGNGIFLNKMWSVTRNRETIFADFVFKNHKDFKNKIEIFYDRNNQFPIEGGDVLVLNKETLIIGISQRTSIDAVRLLSNKLFENTSFKKIIAIDLPKTRSYMHLDTVFTNIDYDKFIVHPLIFDDINNFKIIEISQNGEREIKESLVKFLEDITGKKIQLIKCGGDDSIAAGREQWNDGTNVLAIAPGVVIAYERNWATIELLEKAKVKVLKIPSSELSRGRGGPRCMSMPIVRN
ncbi:arginine deiminase [Spiroplasma endosymbiont of Atherix ibis]|uniref:arginine deiminase n=1 Tax=Spiroplasma endosymbiont of Atherix ibis TaxID=3066291 RepID=UPI0030CC8E56